MANFDFSIPSTVVVSIPAADTVLGCFHTVDEVRKHLQRSKRDLKLCIFRSLPGLPFISSMSSSTAPCDTTYAASRSRVESITRWDRLLQHFRRFAFVTVAVLDGAADDIALSFALACDFAVGTSGAAYVAPSPATVGGSVNKSQLPFWSLCTLAMHVGVANAQRILTADGLSHDALVRFGLLSQTVPDSTIETLSGVAAELIARFPNRRGRTHMQTRNGLISSYAIKGAEHIGHCLAVLNVNVDAALESDPEIVYAPTLAGTDSVTIDPEGTQLVVTFPPETPLEGLGTAMLFTLLGQINTAATEMADFCGRVVFRFVLPATTSEESHSQSPGKLHFAAEVNRLMERESSGSIDVEAGVRTY